MTLISGQNYQPPLSVSSQSDKLSEAFVRSGFETASLHKSDTLIALQDNSRSKKAASTVKTIASAKLSKPTANALSGFMNYSGSVWNLTWIDPSNKGEYARKKQEVEKQVRAFAESIGQTNITNIVVTPSKAPSLVVMGSEERSAGTSILSIANNISWDSNYNGHKIHSENEATIRIGVNMRLGIPYINGKPLKIEKIQSGKGIKNFRANMEMPSLQAIARTSPIESLIKGKVTSKTDTIMGLPISGGFNISLRPFSWKKVIDLTLKGKLTSVPAVTLGLDFSGYIDLGPVRGSLFGEGARFAEGKDWDVKDPLNISISPAAFEAATKNMNPDAAHATEIAGRAVAAKINTSLVVKGTGNGLKFLLGVGLEKLLPAIGSRAAGIAVGARVVALAEPVGWLIAGGLAIRDIYRWNEQRKANYRASVLKLVGLKAFNPKEGLVAALGGIAILGRPDAGIVARLISDTIEEAHKQGLIKNVPELRKEWEKALNFKGNNLVQTQYGRLIAASVLGRKDVIADVKRQLIPVDKSGNAIHTGNNKLQDQLDNSILVTSLENPDWLKSALFGQAAQANNAPYQRIGAAYNHNKPYHSFTAKFMGGLVEAKPNGINDRGTTNWDVTLTTKDGLKAWLTIPMSGQFSLKQLENGQKVKNALINSINAQRAHRKPVPASIKPYRTTLYGNSVIATPLYQLYDELDGKPHWKTMWRVTAKSETGINATVLETIDHQFGVDDLSNGHIFKMRLDAIMRGNAKSEI